MKFKFPSLIPSSKKSWILLLSRWLVLFLILGIFMFITTKMPGESYSKTLPALSKDEAALSQLLQTHVTHLSSNIGPRNIYLPEKMSKSIHYIKQNFESSGYSVIEESFPVGDQSAMNLMVNCPGKNPDEIFVVGAHYDTIFDSPGANDNASGVAALLELAKRFSSKKPAKTIRFIAFANEEPPFFASAKMGSFVSARNSREKNEEIVGMLALEMLGYFSDKPGSQKILFPYGLIYPDKGNFIAFVSNLSSRSLLQDFIKTFRRECHFPSEGLAAPGYLKGVSWSDHRSYWEHDYPAMMVTDTALFRYKWYHTKEDTYEKLNYNHMARIVTGIEKTLSLIIKD